MSEKLGKDGMMARTWTAVYAMERGVTVVRPMSEATLDRVAADDFLARLAADWLSASSRISSAAEEGDVKIDLNAYNASKMSSQIF